MKRTPDKMGTRDNVIAVLGRTKVKPHEFDPTRSHTDKNRIGANVHVLHKRGNVVLLDEWYENLVTDVGDSILAARLYDDGENIITGMKLGTGSSAVTKNGSAAGMGTYISGSQEALDAAATDATKGAGAGWRTTFICTWIAGDVTNSAIAEVCLTNQTAIADNTSAEADTFARFVFGSTIDKQSGDSLEVTWQVDILGA